MHSTVIVRIATGQVRAGALSGCGAVLLRQHDAEREASRLPRAPPLSLSLCLSFSLSVLPLPFSLLLLLLILTLGRSLSSQRAVSVCRPSPPTLLCPRLHMCLPGAALPSLSAVVHPPTLMSANRPHTKPQVGGGESFTLDGGNAGGYYGGIDEDAVHHHSTGAAGPSASDRSVPAPPGGGDGRTLTFAGDVCWQHVGGYTLANCSVVPPGKPPYKTGHAVQILDGKSAVNRRPFYIPFGEPSACAAQMRTAVGRAVGVSPGWLFLSPSRVHRLDCVHRPRERAVAPSGGRGWA